MSDINEQLDRLLRRAASAPRPAADLVEVPFPVQARVLAAWRAGRAEGGDLSGLLRWFRLGLACAGAVAALAVAVSWPAIPKDAADEITVSASADVAMLQ